MNIESLKNALSEMEWEEISSDPKKLTKYLEDNGVDVEEEKELSSEVISKIREAAEKNKSLISKLV